MKLTVDQIEVLKHCALYASRYVPVASFKGKRYILIPEPKCIDWDVQGATIAPLFAEGYLQLVNDTCILTDAGRCALAEYQSSK
ncbi:MAG: hypothetical protein IKO72_09060 [Kiritimatiellae bacterium]|nr:hypothetical protein [Kiritimatiellia bacterium]